MLEEASAGLTACVYFNFTLTHFLSLAQNMRTPEELDKLVED